MRPSGSPQELERRRRRALGLLREGLLPSEVAQRVGVDRRSVRRWKAAARLAGHGSAQVWTVARDAGPPVAVVSAKDVDALRTLLAPLPHYGAQSWLVFDDRRALDRGVWPAPGRLIAVQD